ncbi:MAG: 30S ribosomal protein S8 [Candidatus Spechtbacterales bacterium]
MDLTADMLTIIRNAQLAKHATVKAPYSRVNFGIAEILKKERRVKNFEIKKRGEKSWIIVELAYESDGAPVIRDIQRISKLGKRIYAGYKEMPIIEQGYGLAIVSTPNGIMTGKEARKQKVGGEILCKVL